MAPIIDRDKIPNARELAPYVSAILEAAHAAENEEQLKIKIEDILKTICTQRDIFWNPYTYEHSFRSGTYRLDAVHGSTIIEYEPPLSFNRMVGSQLRHARQQAEDCCKLLAEEEGRRNGAYTLVVWDGETISFGYIREDDIFWDDPQPFDADRLYKLLLLIEQGGKPLVSPMTLKQFIGPDTEVGRQVIPALYGSVVEAIASSSTTRTKLIFTEWARLFGQVDGISSERLQTYLSSAAAMHGTSYEEQPQAYVFALNTYIAIVAKVCAVHALMDKGEEQLPTSSSAIEFLRKVEDGSYFQLRGIQNMLTTDFFTWYLGEDVAPSLQNCLQTLLTHLGSMDFDVSMKSPESVIDLFKGLYMEFTPAPMRHALGEYYTPDWLASHVIETAGWDMYDSLLDPTCGSGTFLLEAVKRRLEDAHPKNTAKEILEGLYGFDLNPLAVLTARASLVVFLSDHFSASEKTLLPVYLADAINTADPVDGVFTHSILTEKGERTFAIPYEVATSLEFYDVMNHLRACVDANIETQAIMSALEAMSVTVRFLDVDMKRVLAKTVDDLVELHRSHWNGIWCFILFDRIKAGCVSNVDYVVGNPPWVKWSNLPRPYAEFIKPICERMDIFSEDSWVGGIQSDISTVVTYHALERFVRKGGTLAFLITGTVFKNESSQGFRRWTLHAEDGCTEQMSVELVEDYKEIRPFEGVANWPTLLLVRRNGAETTYPITYRIYRKPSNDKKGPGLLSKPECMQATPVPGAGDGPWLVGTPEQLPVWSTLLDAGSSTRAYGARKGVTTDANGIYFVNASPAATEDKVRIANDPSNGRRRLSRITTDVGSKSLPNGEVKVIVPDHKVYFIPVESEDEAAYLTAFLNSRSVSGAISAYASALSLGTSVVDYLRIPKYDHADDSMRELSTLGKELSRGRTPAQDEEQRLDDLVTRIVSDAGA